jgi:hypothetical protein
MAEQMLYRHEFEGQRDPAKLSDIFDGSNYRKLKETNVETGNKRYEHKFFNGARDIALGLSTDGWAPFRRRSKTCWPLLIFNYNLPPDVRFHLEHMLCIGAIPGPKKPHDFDSFIWPLMAELFTLIAGVNAFDRLRDEMFILRAYCSGWNYCDAPTPCDIPKIVQQGVCDA